MIEFDRVKFDSNNHHFLNMLMAGTLAICLSHYAVAARDDYIIGDRLSGSEYLKVYAEKLNEARKFNFEIVQIYRKGDPKCFT